MRLVFQRHLVGLGRLIQCRTPGTTLPKPPPVPNAPGAAPATLGTTGVERDRAVAPGFKRMRLENGQYLTVPESWIPEDPSI